MPQIINTFQEFIAASIKNPHAHFKVNPDNSLTVYNKEDKWTSRFGNVKTFIGSGFSAESVRAKNNWSVAKWVDEKALDYRAEHPDSKLANFGIRHVTSVKSGGEDFAGDELFEYVKTQYGTESDEKLQTRMAEILRKLRISEIRVQSYRKEYRPESKWRDYFANCGGNHRGSTSSMASIGNLSDDRREAMANKLIYADALDEDLYVASQKAEEARETEETNEVATVSVNLTPRVKDVAERFTAQVEKIRNYRKDSLFQDEFNHQYMQPFYELEDELKQLQEEVAVAKEETLTRSGKNELKVVERLLENAKKTAGAFKGNEPINQEYLENIWHTYCLQDDFDKQIDGLLSVQEIDDALDDGYPFKYDPETKQFVVVAERETIGIALTGGKLIGHIPERLITLEEALGQGKIQRSTALILRCYALVEDFEERNKFIKETADIANAGASAYDKFTRTNSGAAIEAQLRGVWESICAINYLAGPHRNAKGELTHKKLQATFQLLSERHAMLCVGFESKFAKIKEENQFVINATGDTVLYNKERVSTVTADHIGAIAFARLFCAHMKKEASKEEMQVHIRHLRGLEKAVGILKDDIKLDIDYSQQPYLLQEIHEHLAACNAKGMSVQQSSALLTNYYQQKLPSLSDAALAKFKDDASEMMTAVHELPEINEETLVPGLNPIVSNRAIDLFNLIVDEVDRRITKAASGPSESAVYMTSTLGNIPPEDLLELYNKIVTHGRDYVFSVDPIKHLKPRSPYNFVRFTEKDRQDYLQQIDVIFTLLSAESTDITLDRKKRIDPKEIAKPTNRRLELARHLDHALGMYKTRLDDAREENIDKDNNSVPVNNKEHLEILNSFHNRVRQLVQQLSSVDLKKEGFNHFAKVPVPKIVGEADVKEAPILEKARAEEEVKSKPAVKPKPSRAFPEVGVKKTAVGFADAEDVDEVNEIVRKPVVKKHAQLAPLTAEEKQRNALVDYLVEQVVAKQERAMLPAEKERKPIDKMGAAIAIVSYIEAIKAEQNFTEQLEQVSARQQDLINDGATNPAADKQLKADLRGLSSESDRVNGEIIRAQEAKIKAKNALATYLRNQNISTGIGNIIAQIEKAILSNETGTLIGASNNGIAPLPYKAH